MTRAQAYQHLSAAYETVISDGIQDDRAIEYLNDEIRDMVDQAGLSAPEQIDLKAAATQFCRAIQEVAEQFSNLYALSEKHK